VVEVKQRLKQALRLKGSNDSDKPGQVTSPTLLIRALRADLGDERFLGDPVRPGHQSCFRKGRWNR